MKIDAQQIQDLVARYKKKRAPTDVVGLDVTKDGVAAVRMRKSDTEISVLSVSMLPPVQFPSAPAHEGAQVDVPVLELPSPLKAKYACLTAPGENAVVKLLSFPGKFDEAAEAKVVENLGLDHPENYRVSFKTITESSGKTEARVLAVALPDAEAMLYPQLLPVHIPAPFSLEVSGLATMTAFLHFLGDKATEDAAAIIDFGSNTTTFAIFNKGVAVLIRRFNFGTNALLDKVRDNLGVDMETAAGIIADGAFDISQSVGEVMEPIIKQLIVSRDFVERRENCHISKLYVSGGLVVSRDSVEEMRGATGIPVESWNPFQGLGIQQGAVPDSVTGQEWKFSAAIGACLATFEET